MLGVAEWAPQPGYAGQSVAVSLTRPEARTADGKYGTWFLSAGTTEDLNELAEAPHPSAAGDQLVDRQRDVSIIFLQTTDEIVTGVMAWKGLFAINEIFYAAHEDGGWTLSDHFKNALAAVPVSARSMSDDAVLDHYLSGAVFDRLTYSRGIQRLANGDRLDIDIATRKASIKLVSRHRAVAVDEPDERHLDRLDGALEDFVGPLRSVDNVGVSFSGGVDSTLLLSYMGQAGTAVTMVPDSPEFGNETQYAIEASQLLGRTIEEWPVHEVDYLQKFENAMDAMAMPLESNVVPMLSDLYLHPSSVFLVGEAADSIFGSGRGIRRISAALSGRPGRALLAALGHTPGVIGRRAKQIDGYAELFGQPSGSPDGYAGRSLEYYGDTSIAYQMFAADEISRVFTDRVTSVTDRVEIETPEKHRFFRHIEIAQWRFIFADLAIHGQHAVHAHGKSQVQPFSSYRVISEALKVPAQKRYVKGLNGKWMLKALLSKRVPDYQVNKKKLATGLPFARYYESGPLQGFWDKYDVPSLFSNELRSKLVGCPTAVTWHAINHAMWLKRIVENADLAPHPAACAGTWSIG